MYIYTLYTCIYTYTQTHISIYQHTHIYVYALSHLEARIYVSHTSLITYTQIHNMHTLYVHFVYTYIFIQTTYTHTNTYIPYRVWKRASPYPAHISSHIHNKHVYMYICLYEHMCIYIYIYIYIYVYIYVYTLSHLEARISLSRTYPITYTQQTCIYAYMYIYMYLIAFGSAHLLVPHINH